MTNAFEALGLNQSLIITQDELNAAFREAGKSVHPDAGGGEGEFAALQKAYETIASPSRRLRHWLELRGVEVDTRGTIGPEIMDLFSRLSDVTQRADVHARKKQNMKSALGLAMLEGESHQCREQVEEMNREIESAIQRECGTFQIIEKSDPVDVDLVAEKIRNLVFLEKWQASMRGLFSKLL